jgi:integrase
MNLVNKMKAHITDLSLYRLWLGEKRNLSEGSVQVYCEAVECFLKGNPDIDSLEDYNNFIIEHAIKKRCYHYYSALKAFIEYKITDANTRSRITDNMIRAQVNNDIKMERKYLTEDEILEVINHIKEPKHKVIALIQCLTGVRVGDVLRLKRDNIMPEEYKGKPVLRINITGKGKKRNVIFIHDDVAQELIMDYITHVFNHDDYYFIELGKMKNRKGDINSEYRLLRMNYSWFWTDLKEAMQSCGINFSEWSTHDFRRAFARRVWEKYKDIHVLQGLLHHANPTVTLRYLEQSGLKNVDYHYDMQMGNNKGS